MHGMSDFETQMIGTLDTLRCDVAYQAEIIKIEAMDAYRMMSSPFAILKPPVFKDGNQWCALYGEDLQAGVAGFGDTPAKAVDAFNRAWITDKAAALKEQA